MLVFLSVPEKWRAEEKVQRITSNCYVLNSRISINSSFIDEDNTSWRS